MIELKRICKTYRTGKTQTVKAADNIDLRIENGDVTAIVGTSGAGKSTLLKIIGLVERADSGEYLLDGKDIAKCSDAEASRLRNRKISFVMQDFALINQFTVFENIELPLLLSKEKNTAKKRREMVENALSAVGIQDLAKRPVCELSGGQKQRAAIARALVNNSDVILADEPTGALDSKTSSEIMSTLLELNEKGKTIIIVTHDPKIASLCRRVVTISDGCLNCLKAP